MSVSLHISARYEYGYEFHTPRVPEKSLHARRSIHAHCAAEVLVYVGSAAQASFGIDAVHNNMGRVPTGLYFMDTENDLGFAKPGPLL